MKTSKLKGSHQRHSSMRAFGVSVSTERDLMILFEENSSFTQIANESLWSGETGEIPKSIKSHTPSGATQKLLEFDGTKETRRVERVQRILGTVPKVETAARYFDERAYEEATQIVTGVNALGPSSENLGRVPSEKSQYETPFLSIPHTEKDLN